MTRLKVKPNDSRFDLRDAITYSPFVLCGGCGVIIRESSLIGDLCDKCQYGEGVVDSPECLKAKQGDGEGAGPDRPPFPEGGKDERNEADNVG